MSQIEQNFRDYLARRPEISKAYGIGLINRRALARHLIDKAKIAKPGQFEAVLAMIRRFPFKKHTHASSNSLFKEMSVKFRDDIAIVEVEGSHNAQEAVKELQSLANLSSNEVYKIVVGSNALTLFIAQDRLQSLKKSGLLHKAKINSVCELSITFPLAARETQGIIARVTGEFLLHEVKIVELMSSNNELLIYVEPKDVVDTLSLLNDLKTKEL